MFLVSGPISPGLPLPIIGVHTLICAVAGALIEIISIAVLLTCHHALKQNDITEPALQARTRLGTDH